jgi:hypothetical protein
MSDASRILAAILLIAVPTVEFGGLALLGMLTRRTAGYLDNPLRQNLFRAGHAHAGCGWCSLWSPCCGWTRRT